MDRDQAVELAKSAGVSPLLAALLSGRGLRTPEELHALLDSGSFSDPFLMKDMDRAVQRIRQAIEDFESIAVYGDYDADGVTATAILYTYLRDKGAKVSFYIPQRDSEGYGMNLAALDTLSREGVDLIITVDNGVSAVDEIAYAKNLGMDVVVTDHHQPHEQLPTAACAIVDAHQQEDGSPFKELSGAGVALKLLMALEGGDPQAVLDQYADLAALGTVGDSVPLQGENRLLVLAGLEVIGQRRRPGLDAVLDLGREKPSSTKLAFSAVPCINATGRMGAPERAVRLLTHRDSSSAQALAKELRQENTRRKTVEREILDAAVKQVEGDPQRLYARVIVAAGEDWHLGVVGIVASRLTERYGKPSFVLSADGSGCYRGSGRSIEGFSMFGAVNACQDLLERYGGHPMAAGLTVKAENLSPLIQRLNQYAQENHPQMPAPTLRLDCALKPSAVNARTVRDLQPLEPFGTGNPQPLFGIYGVTLQSVQSLGLTGGHCRLRCEKEGFSFECLRFGVRAEEFPFPAGAVVDLAVNLQLNDYPRGRGFDFLVRDVKLSGIDPEQWIEDARLYEKYRRGEALAPEEAQALLPSREQFGLLYRRLAKGTCGLLALAGELDSQGLGLGKLLLALDVLEERGLAKRQGQDEQASWRLLPHAQKVDLSASPCLAGLAEVRP